MTDENLSAGLDAQQQPDVSLSNSETSSENQVQVEEPKQQDLSGYVHKDRVNKIVVDAKSKAYEKGLAEARNASSNFQHQDQKNVGIDDSKIDEILSQKLESLREQERQRVQQERIKSEVDEICGKLNASAVEFSKSNPDYKEALERVNNFQGAEAILEIASNLDNPAEVIYYLANNPREIPNLNSICYSYKSAGASELKKISDRLKQNSTAKNSQSAPSPISQIESENRNGIGAPEANSFADFKRKYTV